MYKREEEAGALLCGTWFCVLLRSRFVSFSVVGIVAHFAYLGGGDLDIELDMVSNFVCRGGT